MYIMGRYCHRYNFVTVAGHGVEMHLGDLPGGTNLEQIPLSRDAQSHN
jgi:hypothetical protein